MMQLPDVHCVYSVPAFVRFFVTYHEMVILPTIKVSKKRVPEEAEIAHEPGIQVLRSVLEKRLGKDSMRRLFGEPDEAGRFAAVEKLIFASGGALRDLLRLCREVL